MRLNRLTIVVALVVVVAPFTASAQLQELPGLRLFVRPSVSIEPVYVVPPVEGAERLYFVGEPLSIEMEIVNQTGASVVLVADDPARGVSLRLRRLEGRLIFDGPIVDVPIRYRERPERVYGDASQAEALQRRIALAETEALRWTADVDMGAVAPGTYVFHASPAVTEESGVATSAIVSGFTIEVRDPAAPDAAREFMLRAGVRALVENHFQEAELLLQNMLVKFPDSAIAASTLGDVYAAQGRRNDARQMYETARGLLSTGADIRFVERKGGATTSSAIRGLDERIGRMSQ